MTNYSILKNKTLIELADFLCEHSICSICDIICGDDDCIACGKNSEKICKNKIIEWLMKEAK